ncbi:hypothetical protein ACWIGI_28840 [Nocardia sp. NPDC055321]
MVNVAETVSATVREVVNQLAIGLQMPAELTGIVDRALRPCYEDVAAAYFFAQHPALFSK